MAVDVAMLDEPALSLLCGISKEKGIDHFRIFDFSVNIDKFLEYLIGLREAHGDAKVCIFMDNLSVHTSERAKAAMREHGFRYIYNVPYSPEYNPIEMTFSEIKTNFRKLRTKKFTGLIQDSHEALIRTVVTKITKKNVNSCIEHVIKLLR